MSELDCTSLKALAEANNLEILGVTDAERLEVAEKRYRAWLDCGYGADMSYLRNNVDLRFDPSKLLPGAKSTLVVAVRYVNAVTDECPFGYGRVARYAWGRDYHKLLCKLLGRFVDSIEAKIGRQLTYRVFTDSAPILERELAVRAGLGFVGKNTMLIRPGIGSYFFLAEVVSDLVVELNERRLEGDCGQCKLCLDNCSARALVRPYTLDARRCVSYLTVEKKGELSHKERISLREWIFGCDRCQEICPHNSSFNSGENGNLWSVGENKGPGPFLNLEDVLNIRDHEMLVKSYAGTALMRAGREAIVRNAVVVAANTKVEQLSPKLVSLFMDDLSPIVRQHSLWAVHQLQKSCNIMTKKNMAALLEYAIKEGSPGVAKEAVLIMEERCND